MISILIVAYFCHDRTLCAFNLADAAASDPWWRMPDAGKCQSVIDFDIAHDILLAINIVIMIDIFCKYGYKY